MSPFRRAGYFWAWVLRVLGAEGITMPWGRSYLLNYDDRKLRRHEFFHLKQIRSDGPLCFSVRYVVWTIHRGYWWNPYEVAARVGAREVEADPRWMTHPTLGPVIRRTLE